MKKNLIEKVWADKVQALWALPETDYPIIRALIVTMNKYNEILLDNTKIHIPRVRNRSLLTAYLTWDKYKVVSGSGEIINEEDYPYIGNFHKIHIEMIIEE